MIRIPGDFSAWFGRRGRATLDAHAVLDREADDRARDLQQVARPYTRWWWLGGPFRREDIRGQLEWLRANGFGGVELAWLRPSWLEGVEPGIEWLGLEWSDLVAFTKEEADRLGLGCDFTHASFRADDGVARGLQRSGINRASTMTNRPKSIADPVGLSRRMPGGYSGSR